MIGPVPIAHERATKWIALDFTRRFCCSQVLNNLDDEGETFLAEIHADQGIYLESPQPPLVERT